MNIILDNLQHIKEMCRNNQSCDDCIFKTLHENRNVCGIRVFARMFSEVAPLHWNIEKIERIMNNEQVKN